MLILVEGPIISGEDKSAGELKYGVAVPKFTKAERFNVPPQPAGIGATSTDVGAVTDDTQATSEPMNVLKASVITTRYPPGPTPVRFCGLSTKGAEKKRSQVFVIGLKYCQV
jgi:hypothetical protein